MMNMSNELALLIYLRFIWLVQKEMESIATNSDNANINLEYIVLKVLGGHRLGHARG